MTDLEITRLCAEAMGYYQRKITDGGSKVWVIPHHPDPQCAPSEVIYAPLHDDAQAMALVKKMNINIGARAYPEKVYSRWYASSFASNVDEADVDLNRAICECVAKLQQAKEPHV